jgi:ferredoxin
MATMGRLTPLYSALFKRSFGKRFQMAKMTRIPLVGRAMEYAFFENDDIIILPKDQVAKASQEKRRTIQMDKEVEPSNVMLPSQVIEHFISISRYIFLMDHCMCRNSNGCKDYPSDLGCIFLGRGTLRIPENMGRMVSKDEALDHLRKCRDAGLVHLIGRDKIDSVWLGTGGKENLLSICSCCPCCCLWKMLPNLSPSIKATVTKMPGVSVAVDPELCNGCGACVRKGICYLNAIRLTDDKAKIGEVCRGCGRCVEFCPRHAIHLHIEDSDFLSSAIKRIEPLVDVVSE